MASANISGSVAPLGLPSFSAAASGTKLADSATDVFTIAGSAKGKVKVTRITLSGIATAAASALVNIIKRGAVDTGGTATNPTKVARDSAVAEPSFATVNAYTANPTINNTVGTVHSVYLKLGTSSAPPQQTEVIDFMSNGLSPIVLRSAAEQLAVNFNGATYAGGYVSCTFEWMEE